MQSNHTVILGILAGYLWAAAVHWLVKQEESVKKAWNNVQTESQNRADWWATW